MFLNSTWPHPRSRDQDSMDHGGQPECLLRSCVSSWQRIQDNRAGKAGIVIQPFCHQGRRQRGAGSEPRCRQPQWVCLLTHSLQSGVCGGRGCPPHWCSAGILFEVPFDPCFLFSTSASHSFWFSSLVVVENILLGRLWQNTSETLQVWKQFLLDLHTNLKTRVELQV